MIYRIIVWNIEKDGKMGVSNVLFEESLEIRENLKGEVDKNRGILKGYEVGNAGVVPERIKNTDGYKKAKDNYIKSLDKLREYNTWFNIEYKEELKKRRTEN